MNDINRKSEDLIKILKKSNFTKQDIVFLLVEFRKIMESRQIDFQVLNFYCGWALHYEKDYIPSSMKEITECIYKSIVKEMNNPMKLELRQSVRKFIYFERLRRDLISFCSKLELPTEFVQTKSIWTNFIGVLVKILEEQPIIDPINEIRAIKFTPSIPKGVICKFTFTNPLEINGKTYKYYQIMNYYG